MAREATSKTDPRTLPLPETMRAAAIDRHGGPASVTIHSLPLPVPKDSEVLVAVHTSSLAGWDGEMRAGWSPTGRKPRFPFVLGTDGSGTVVRVGARIRRLRVGDRVYGSRFEKAGFHAEYVALPAEDLALVPKGIDLEHAGAAPLTGVTAQQGIDTVLRVKAGDTLIVHGASGGVGSIALQIAKLRGAVVLATASGSEGVRFVRSLGADVAVDGKHGDVRATAREIAPSGVDKILALAGGKGLERCIAALRPGGLVAHPNGVEPAPEKRKGLEIRAYDGVPGAEHLDRLARVLEQAGARIPIAARYPLEEAARAHRRLAKRPVLGRIVLRIGS